MCNRDKSVCIYTVKRNDKYGIIDENGALLVPIVFDKIDLKLNVNFTVLKDGKWGIIKNPLYSRL